MLAVGCGGSAATPGRASTAPTAISQGSTTRTASTTSPKSRRAVHPVGPPYRIAERVLTFVDHSRLLHYPGGALQPRRLVTAVRYPRAPGPFPMIVFGHGFAVTPAIYSRLLTYWARAGYVVAAPVFPLGNQDAPGGPDENDLVNQPTDMSFVITQLLAASARGVGLPRGLLEAHRIAVSGQSDGGDTALSAAYDEHWHDRRIGAAVILSGQEIPGVGGYTFPSPSPPLLAIQGLADTVNLPSTTYEFFSAAPSPKYLLTLPGAAHLGPYTGQQPQLGIVERVSTAFLDLYLKGERDARRRLLAAGNRPGVADLHAG